MGKSKRSSIDPLRYLTPKFCKACKTMKTEADFSLYSYSKTGYKPKCKNCIKNKIPLRQKKNEEDGFKICGSCLESKPISDFYNYASSKDGKNKRCKLCVTNKVSSPKPLTKEGFKVCRGCGEEKKFNEYTHYKNKPFGRCKMCVREYYYLRKGEVAPDVKNKKPIVDEGYKFCNSCETVQPVNMFGPNKRSKDKLRYNCKKCDCIAAKKRNPPKNTPPLTDKEKKLKRNSIRRERYSNDPLYRFETLIRCRINDSFKVSSWRKGGRTEKLIGNDYKNTMKHIESQFLSGMSWENQGTCRGEDCDRVWHIDHIVPLSWAKNEEEMSLLCHYTNLQPLWRDENIRKHCKVYPCTNIDLKITFLSRQMYNRGQNNPQPLKRYE